ncbi:MAG: ribosome-associated translation inhibitor RaiA [Chloroflexi bacterium]|nr:MAG: ribosome-associated translation inhibitor RaiA [Chloroflexota bacterium]
MKVVIQDRTEELNSRLRAYTERRLSKLSRHFEKVLEAEVHFDAESRRGARRKTAVKILVHMDGRRAPVLKAEERGHELQATLDLALDQVDRQVLKLKDKIIDRHRAGPATNSPSGGQQGYGGAGEGRVDPAGHRGPGGQRPPLPPFPGRGQRRFPGRLRTLGRLGRHHRTTDHLRSD